MENQIKKWLITVFGGFMVIIGAIFILLPGPAFLFIPIGLALLSLEYDIARVWLKKSQKLMKQSAVKTDLLIARCRRKMRK